MKIVCDSCGAKYSIADEKVAGRVFKIRCKKCGAAIVVRGDAGADAGGGGAAAGGFDYGGEAVWHVVVDGDQQGPFTPVQLGGMISANTIGWDAYVWREGFEDWKPAQDIEELVQQIMNPGGGGSSEGAAEPADPFAAAPAASAPAASAKSSAPGKSRDVGADLFAQSDSASPFGGGGDDDVVASSPSPRVSQNQAMTGQRNENSVLFSLSNLQALATGGSGGGGGGGGGGAAAKPIAASSRAGHATGEGSGLIDIRALAGATGLGAPTASAPVTPARVDDLLSIGGPSVGLGSALAAPVIIPDKKEEGGGRGVIIAAAVLGICVLAGAGAVVAVMMNQPDPAAVAAAGAPPAAAGAITPGAPPAAGSPGVGTPAVPPPAAGGVTPPPTPPATDPTAAAGGTTPPPATGSSGGGSSGGSSGGRRASSGGGSSSGSSGGSSGAAVATGSSGGSSSSGGGSSSSSSGSSGGRSSGGGGDRSLDALLEGALSSGGSSGGSGGRSSSSSGGSSSSSGGGSSGGDADLPETPSRAQVVSAMGGISAAVSACGAGAHGTATVALTVSGSTGRVTNATVSGEFAGTPVGSCIARAARGATFPHFSRSTFTVNYPFRI